MEKWRLELFANDSACFMSEREVGEQGLRPSVVDKGTCSFRGGMTIMIMKLLITERTL